MLCNHNLDRFFNFNIMDDLLIKEPLDGSRINLHEPYEVSYWCKKINCTVTELQNAVHAVGTSKAKVQAYLHG